MSSFSQPYWDSKVKVRTELYACTQRKVSWIDELLAAMARYPIEHRTHLAELDTVDVGQPIDQHNSAYTAIMLVPPGPIDPPTLGLVGGMSESILVHQLVGLSPSELQYSKTHTSRDLWERIAQAGEQVLDELHTLFV